MASSAMAEQVKLPRLASPTALLYLVSTAHAVTHVYAALFPLVYPALVKEWDVSYGLLGAMVGLTGFLSGVLQLGFGFAGRYFPRNVMLGLGNIGLGLATGLSALVTGFGQFTVLRCLAAVANAPQHPVGNSLIADQYPKARRGYAMAVNFAGGNLGTLLVPLIAVAAMAAWGWQATLAIFAVPGIVIGVVLLFAISDVGRADPDAQLLGGSMLSQLRRVVWQRNVVILLAASSIAAGGRGLGVLLPLMPLYLANQLGYDASTIGVLYTIMLVGSVVGPMFGGRLSDRFGRRAVIVGALLLSSVSTVALIGLGQAAAPVLAVLLFFMGAFTFTESPVIQSFMADSVQSGGRDLLFGFYFAWVFAIGALWIAFIGAVIDWIGFDAGWGIVAASYTLAAIPVFFAKEQAEVSK